MQGQITRYLCFQGDLDYRFFIGLLHMWALESDWISQLHVSEGLFLKRHYEPLATCIDTMKKNTKKYLSLLGRIVPSQAPGPPPSSGEFFYILHESLRQTRREDMKACYTRLTADIICLGNYAQRLKSSDRTKREILFGWGLAGVLGETKLDKAATKHHVGSRGFE